MKSFLIYWLWPNPAGWHYGDQRVMVLLGVSVLLIVVSFIIRCVRPRFTNAITRHLTSSWSLASFWFGVVALLLVVCRTEMIQFLSMRVLWAVWALLLGLYALFQMLQFRRRHYTMIKQTRVVDERDKYLPRKNR